MGQPGDAQLKVPRGFEIEEYATGFNTPRFMYTAPGGEIILSDSSAGTVYVLVDKNKSYKDPERKKILIRIGPSLWPGDLERLFVCGRAYFGEAI